ncbi:glycolate oxidase subunit [Bordetella pertussis]|nr:glycolate oxidase subunit [Bordetella pertussis]
MQAAREVLGGELLDAAQAHDWWESLREQSHAFFDRGMPLWRLAVPPTAPALALGPTLIEWGGGQRWLSGHYDAQAVRAAAAQADGVAAITRRLKQELDPAGLFNPGRLVPEL